MISVIDEIAREFFRVAVGRYLKHLGVSVEA